MHSSGVHLTGLKHAYSSAIVRNAAPGLCRKYSAAQALRTTCPNVKKLYLILSGYAKTSAISDLDEEDIFGFALPGDVLGLSALSACALPSEVIFLTDALVAELTLEDALRLDIAVGGLSEGVGDLISRELLQTQWRNRFVRHAPVTTRVSQFLLELGRRFEEIDLSAHKFRLFMPREDLAIFLGMTKCTLSRTLHSLCRRKLIDIDGSRWIEILDPDGLARV
jgi:CRP/FNR family transcriptional regulator